MTTRIHEEAAKFTDAIIACADEYAVVRNERGDVFAITREADGEYAYKVRDGHTLAWNGGVWNYGAVKLGKRNIAKIVEAIDAATAARQSVAKAEAERKERRAERAEYVPPTTREYNDRVGNMIAAGVDPRTAIQAVDATEAIAKAKAAVAARKAAEAPEVEVDAVEVVKLTEACEVRDLTLWYDVLCSVYGKSAGECQQSLERDLTTDAPGSVERLQDIARRARIALGCEKPGDLGGGRAARSRAFDERMDLLAEAAVIADERYRRIAADVGVTPQQVRDVEAFLAAEGITALEVRRAVEDASVEYVVEVVWVKYGHTDSPTREIVEVRVPDEDAAISECMRVWQYSTPDTTRADRMYVESAVWRIDPIVEDTSPDVDEVLDNALESEVRAGVDAYNAGFPSDGCEEHAGDPYWRCPTCNPDVDPDDLEPDVVDDDFPMYLEYNDIEGLTAPLEPESYID
jgi:hypothetical protein